MEQNENYFEVVPIETGDAYVGSRLEFLASFPIRPIAYEREKIGPRVVYTLTGPNGNCRGQIALLPWVRGWRLTSRLPINWPDNDIDEALFRDEWHRTLVDSILEGLRQLEIGETAPLETIPEKEQALQKDNLHLPEEQIYHLLKNRSEMKQHYEGYNPTTALEIYKAIPKAHRTYEQEGGRWGPGCIAKRVGPVAETVGRYLKAFKAAGITHTHDNIEIPHQSRS